MSGRKIAKFPHRAALTSHFENFWSIVTGGKGRSSSVGILKNFAAFSPTIYDLVDDKTQLPPLSYFGSKVQNRKDFLIRIHDNFNSKCSLMSLKALKMPLTK